MKRPILITLLTLIVCAGLVIAQNAPTTQPPAEAESSEYSQKQDASYAMGVVLAYSITQSAPYVDEIDPEQFLAGFNDIRNHEDLKDMSYALGVLSAIDASRQGAPLFIDLDEAQLKEGFANFRNREDLRLTSDQLNNSIFDYADKWITITSARNKVVGEAFLEENAKKEGVVTTDSGLQYKIIAEGDGATPQQTDIITAYYKGTLLNGEVFDAAQRPDEPMTIPMANLIDGWKEGLPLIKEGGKIMLYVPAQLAYKDSPTGPGGPTSTLIFELELVKTEPAPAPPAMPTTPTMPVEE